MTKLNRIFITAIALALVAAFTLPAQSVPDDQIRIAEQVRKRIMRLDNYGVFDHITFGIDGENRVLLRGYAAKPTLKKSAERVVKKIEGVSAVVNEIEVLPTSGMDEDVRLSAYAKIYGHPTLRRYNPNRGTPMWVSPARLSFGISQDPPRGYHPINIIVANGHITLEGVIDNEMDKQLAEMQASSVSGAFSVTNNLLVLNPGVKAD